MCITSTQTNMPPVYNKPTTGSIPTQWCTHCITPVHKSSNKSFVNNYRPISLLCILSKVLEKLVYNKILFYLENSFTKYQYGFLPGRSVDVIYMDFRKAFNSVSHNGLLTKLKSLGIAGKFWLWLWTYLIYRFQCVCIGNSISDYCDVLSGVPQGSVLGPCYLSYLLMIFLKVLSL